MTKREPLVIRSAVTAAATAVLHVLVIAGALPIDEATENAVAGALDLVGLAVVVVWSRGKVTPVDAPAGVDRS